MWKIASHLAAALVGAGSLAAVALLYEEEAIQICPSGTTQRSYREHSSDDHKIDVLVCESPDGTRQGPFIQWLDGNLFSAGVNHDGKPHGAFVAWEANGRLRSRANYEHGKVTRAELWNEAGAITWEKVDIGNSSVITLWHANGNLRARFARTADGVETHETWYESGQPKASGSHLNGLSVGVWQCWNDDGSATGRITFSNDGVITKKSGDDDADWMSPCVRSTPRCSAFDTDANGVRQASCAPPAASRTSPSA